MFFRLLHYVVLRRKLVQWVTLIFFAAGLLCAILREGTYRTKALLMPPLEEGREGLLSAWMAQLNLPSMVAPVTAGATSAAVLVDILESRHLGEIVVESLDLKDRFGVGTMDEAIRLLSGRTKFTATKTGLISMSVRAEDPALAVRIAEWYITGLDSLNRLLQFTRAEQTMEFISNQIERYRSQLEDVREEIAGFQKQHGIIDFEEQVRGAIDVAAGLKVRTVLAEIERDLLREFARRDASELQRKEAEFRNLTQQLNKIMEGDTSEAVFIPLRKLPELYQRYAALQRDLEVNERVYSFLLERYEESGIDRARNTPTVQVVDKPNLPERPSGLPRWSIALIITLIGFLWISGVVAWWGWISTRERTEEEEQAFHEVVRITRRDIERLRRFLRL